MTFARFLVGLACLAPGLALAASVQDIRIASHPDHIRIVLDLDGAVTFTPAGVNAFDLRGLSGGGAVMNAGAKDAPLKRVVLTPEGGGTKLTFETNEAVTAKAFPIGAGADGGHRFVVDLYRVQQAPVAEANTSSNITGPAPTFVTRGPAVPAAPMMQPPQAQAQAQPSAPVSNSYAAVAPSNPPDIGPTPYEGTQAQPPAPTATPASPIAMANAAPVNTIPFNSPADGAAPAPAMQPAPTGVAAPQVSGVSVDERALRAERALDRGDARAACADANEAIRVSPQDLRALAVLGSCQLALGDAVSARAAFTNALAIDPGYHRARIGLAETDVRQGDVAGARQEYRRVLADNPPTDETYKILDALQALAPPTPLSITAQGT